MTDRRKAPISISHRHNGARLLSFGRRTMCIDDWAKRLGVTGPAILYRLKRWPLTEALSKPQGNQGRARAKSG